MLSVVPTRATKRILKAHRLVAFRPNAEVARMIAVLDAAPGVNHSDLFNRAMALGFPTALAEFVRNVGKMGVRAIRS
jgi:hypothetical protein